MMTKYGAMWCEHMNGQPNTDPKTSDAYDSFDSQIFYEGLK